MNDLSEIKISFGNEKVQNTHSEENNKDRISDESQIPYLLLHFNENLGKKFYKKTIKENIFLIDLRCGWILRLI